MHQVAAWLHLEQNIFRTGASTQLTKVHTDTKGGTKCPGAITCQRMRIAFEEYIIGWVLRSLQWDYYLISSLYLFVAIL